MMEIFNIVDENWEYGSYHRGKYRTDTLYIMYRYKEIDVLYAGGHFYVRDFLCESLLEQQKLSEEAVGEYQNALLAFVSHLWDVDDWPVEEIYEEILRMRRNYLGKEVLERQKWEEMQEAKEITWDSVLCQQPMKDKVLTDAESILFVITEMKWFLTMKEDLFHVLELGKKAIVLCGSEGSELPTKPLLRKFFQKEYERIRLVELEKERNSIHFGKIQKVKEFSDWKGMAMFFYGEDGLLHCKHLRIPTIVHAEPKGFYARALVNQLDCDRNCIVYVPPHFSMIPYVPLVERSVCTYWHLAKLEERYGDVVYSMSVEGCYERWPEVFVDIYQNGKEINTPISISGSVDSYADFQERKEEAIREMLQKEKGVRYLSKRFVQEDGNVLVHGIVAEHSEHTEVLSCADGKTLRQIWKQERKKGIVFCSNFLFFFTKKLALLYNQERGERPLEQIEEKQMALDYCLCWKEGRRVESFPLYKKMIIAMKSDGTFLLCPFRLRGGRIRIGDWTGEWSQKDVDSENRTREIRVYTPYGCKNGGELIEDSGLHLVIIQDQIVCIRKGSVKMPCMGVVLSLTGEMERLFLETCKGSYLKEGYYDCKGMVCEVKLDGPEEISKEEWNTVIWAYGGGMALIKDGKALSLNKSFQEEGWMSRLSQKTQESPIHEMERHPRTGIGVTKRGELVVLVFSGRTKESRGADYEEMCEMALQMVPDLKELMNVDGGGSAMLGIGIDDEFMELSYPATSVFTAAGMARPIHTIFCIRQ